MHLKINKINKIDNYFFPAQIKVSFIANRYLHFQFPSVRGGKKMKSKNPLKEERNRKHMGEKKKLMTF